MIAMAMQENPFTNIDEARDIILQKCMAAQFANRSSIHKIIKLQPGQLAFGRDMLAPFTNQVDWDELINQCQTASNKR